MPLSGYAPTVASESKVSASHGQTINAINDGLLPRDEFDRSAPYYHWWPKKEQQNGFRTRSTLPKPFRVQLYWYDDVPGVDAAFRNGGSYITKQRKPMALKLGQRNTTEKGVKAVKVIFAPVTTQG